jgi:hypothetical protein
MLGFVVVVAHRHIPIKLTQRVGGALPTQGIPVHGILVANSLVDVGLCPEFFAFSVDTTGSSSRVTFNS